MGVERERREVAGVGLLFLLIFCIFCLCFLAFIAHSNACTRLGQAMSCCPPGALPALAEDKALVLNGTVEHVEHLRLYVSRPKEPTKKAILVVYEVHGGFCRRRVLVRLCPLCMCM